MGDYPPTLRIFHHWLPSWLHSMQMWRIGYQRISTKVFSSHLTL